MRDSEVKATFLRLLLLGDSDPWISREDQSWSVVAAAAQQNVVLIRTADALISAGVTPPDHFCALVDREHQRIAEAVGIIDRLAHACQQAGIPFALPKAFQHFPDMGHDIDLLVLSPRSVVDSVVKETLVATAVRRTLTNVVAGKRSYGLPGSATPLELHRNRTGLVGEHPELARRLVERARPDDVGGTTALVPRPEDQFLLQVVQRVYLHRSLRVGDILQGLKLLAKDLDWRGVVSDADGMGIRRGLEYLVLHLDSWSHSMLGRPASPPELSTLLPRRVESTVRPFGGMRDTASVYAAFTSRLILGREWSRVGRLAFIPVLAVASTMRVVRQTNWSTKHMSKRDVG